MKRPPSLKALQAFEAVARLKSVSDAADALFVTQPAISQQLKLLNEQLEVALFEKSGRQLKLTAQGESYAAELHQAFQRIQQATQTLYQPSKKNLITVNLTTTLSITWLINHLMSFYEQYPQYEVRVLTPAEYVDFTTQAIHCAIYASNFPWNPPHAPELDQELLLEDELCVVCSSKHVMKDKYLMTDSTVWAKEWEKWCELSGETLPESGQILRFSSLPQALKAALQGMGNLVARKIFVRDHLESGELKLSRAKPMKNGDKIYWYCPKGALEMPKVLAFKQWLIREIELGAKD